MRPERIAVKKRGPRRFWGNTSSDREFRICWIIPCVHGPSGPAWITAGGGLGRDREVNFRAGDTVDLVPDPQAVSFLQKRRDASAA